VRLDPLEYGYSWVVGSRGDGHEKMTKIFAKKGKE
jgi:hypothetical protein